MTRSKQRDAEKAEAVAELRKILKPGDTVYTVLRHVSASGMSRRIDVYVIRNNEPRCLSGYVGRVLGYSRGKGDGLMVGGAGMDMGFHVVHNLGYALWGDAQNDTAEGRRLRKLLAKSPTAQRYLTQGGAPMPDPAAADGCWFGAAGYALSHAWL